MADIEPTQEPSETGREEPKAILKGRQSLSKIRRELSDDELSSPAVQRMLVDEIERLERDNADLASYRDQFHAVDKRASVLEERSRKAIAAEIIFAVCLSVGSAAMGYAPSAWSSQPSGWLALIFGALIVLGGVVSRVVQR
ncbi:MAG: hypothetical protein AMXMBFR36_29250 [Acidobacteriota bacterium]